MKKIYQSFSLILLSVILLLGCGTIDNTSQTKKNPATSETTNSFGTASNNTKESTETPVPTSGVFTRKQSYSDGEREVSILGLKEYVKLKSDKYKDKAHKGKKYLVLFLKVRNRSASKVYFHADYLSVKVDGKDIQNTFLFNEPEGYPTMFTNIAADSEQSGFIVWEVPQKWKKIEITYQGWKDSDGLTLSSILTKKDISNPEKYSGLN